MKGEINKGFYCSAGYSREGGCRGARKDGRLFQYSSTAFEKDCAGLQCRACRRKHPTPEQFKEEYGGEYPDDGAVYVFFEDPDNPHWVIERYKYVKGKRALTVCACAPFGKPDKDWRPE